MAPPEPAVNASYPAPSARAPRGQVVARKVLLVLALGERAGMDRSALLAEIGLSEPAIADPNGWVPQESWRLVWERVVTFTGDEALGIRAAAGVDPGYFGVIDYAARSCASLAEAVPLAARYFRLANSWGRLDVTRTAAGLRVTRHLLGDELLWLPPQAADFALATMVQVMRLAAACPFPLEQVTLRRPAPRDPTLWRETFACPLHFGAAEDSVTLPTAALDTPMRAPDARLRALVESYARALLAELALPDAPLETQVRHQIAAALAARRAVDLESVARQLGQSPRTLQRRLADQGLQFRALADEVRRALATRYLRAGLSPGEVAFLLGYSEVSAFGRAFLVWEGLPPATWARRGADHQEAGARRQG